MFARVLTRLRIALGWVPNVEWLRARMSRAVVLDRARALVATAEIERCLRLVRAGDRCPRLDAFR